jgi:hypothetical protein
MEKKLVVAVMALALFGASTFAVGFIGTPTAELNKGQWNAGFNYSYINPEMDKFKVEGSSVDFDEVGAVTDAGTFSGKLKAQNTKIQRHYVSVGYGIEDWWQVYAQLGIADMKSDWKAASGESDWTGGTNFDNDLVWGWGTKVTFAKQDKVDWGATLQMNWMDTQWKDKGSEIDGTEVDTWKDTVDIRTWDLLIAVGPTIDMTGWKLYGGPYYYYLNGDFRGKEKGNWVDEDSSGSWIDRGSGDIRADNNFGGYIGAQFDIAQNCTLAVEYSSTLRSDWGIGAGVTVKF